MSTLKTPDEISHKELIDYAILLFNGRTKVSAENFGHYIPDVVTSNMIIECKAWTVQEYAQFKELAKIKNRKKLLLIHLPQAFDDIWVIHHHGYQKKEIPIELLTERKEVVSKMYKLRGKDERMLEMLVSKDAVIVASELDYESPNPLYQRLHRIRKRRVEAQKFVNKLNNFSSRSPRLRKFLTSGQISDLKEE